MNVNDLTFLASVKLWVGVAASTDNARLSSLISSISRTILTRINRDSFLKRSVSALLDGNGKTRLLLPDWPVLSITSLLVNGSAIPESPASPNNSGFRLKTWDGIPPGRMQYIDLFGYCFPIGAQNISVSYPCGYVVQNEAATIATQTIPALSVPYGPWAGDAGVSLASTGAAFTRVASAPAANQYSIAQDADTGLPTYTFNAADNSKAILVSYSFIPSDIFQAATEWASERYKYAERIGLRSKSLGGQETVSFDISSVPKFVMDVLSQYQNVVAVR